MLWILLSLFGLLVHFKHQLGRVCVLVAAYNSKEVFCRFERIVELVSLTLEDDHFDCLPLRRESHFVYQKASAVVDVEVTHVVFQKLLKFLRLLLSCVFLLVCNVLFFSRQTEIYHFVSVHHKWLVWGTWFALRKMHHRKLVYITVWIVSGGIWWLTRLDKLLKNLLSLSIATVGEFWEQMFV